MITMNSVMIPVLKKKTNGQKASGISMQSAQSDGLVVAVLTWLHCHTP